MGLTPAARPASRKCNAPNMDPWSVTATAGMPRRPASEKIVGASGLALGGEIRAAPSRRENSECTCRWTNPSADGSLIGAAQASFRGGFSTCSRDDVDNLQPCDSQGDPTYARPRRASRLQVLGAVADPLPSPSQRLFEVRRQGLLDLDPFCGKGMVERQPPRMQERSRQTERARIPPSSSVGPVAEDRMSDRPQVDTDLVRSTGPWCGLNQGRALELFANLE